MYSIGRWQKLGWAVFLLGALLQMWLWSRSWIPLPAAGSAEALGTGSAQACGVAKFMDHESFLRDQVELMDPGLELAEEGRLRPFPKRTSGGGILPGSLLQILIGLPLFIWRDYRAASLLLGALHLLAGWLLFRLARELAGLRFAAIFLVVCWLSPWRLYHSGFLWEPAYVFLPAVLHLWSSWRLWSRSAWGPSLVLGLLISATPQLHKSAAVLALITAGLWLWGRLRLNWIGFGTGLGLGALTLIPTVIAMSRQALPASGGDGGALGQGLLSVYPMLKGLAYWFRIGSLDIGRRLRQTSFWAGDSEPLGFGELLTLGVSALTWLSVLLALWAGWRFLRQASPTRPAEQFLQSYARVALVCALVAVGLSPATVQGWHLLIILPAAAISLAVWLEEGLRRSRPGTRTLLWGLISLQLVLVVLLGLGHPMYEKAQPGDCLPRPRVAELRP